MLALDLSRRAILSRQAVVAVVLLFVGAADPAAGAEAPAERTPARLSLVQDDVSFWRPGSPDWTQARVNLALAPGDALYAGDNGRLEVQIGPRAFVRAGADTQLGIENQEPDFLQIKVTAGDAVADVRELAAGHTLELDTPNAAFTIDQPGYYRAQVAADRTTFVTRRGGSAQVTPAGGQATTVAANQQVVVQGTTNVAVATYAAPALDAWDRWNYGRTDQILAATSTGPLPDGMYGGADLARSGRWETTQQYGRVWVPNNEDPGWAPYTTGDWVADPYYGWTWVDDAPWGWAPYHYGRWVYLNGFWAWAPGPLLVTPVYAPALVAFFGGFGGGIGFGFGPIGWTALGWGEPLFPWWGPAWFIGFPCWLGWGGPHFFAGDFDHFHFHNIHEPHGFVGMPGGRFGHDPVQRAAFHHLDPTGAHLIRGALPMRGSARNMTTALGHGVRPPQNVLARSVVATRAPVAPREMTSGRFGGQPPRLVSAPRRALPVAARPAGPGSLASRSRPALPLAVAGRGRGAMPAGRGGSFSYAARSSPPSPPRRVASTNPRSMQVQDAFARGSRASWARTMPAPGAGGARYNPGDRAGRFAPSAQEPGPARMPAGRSFAPAGGRPAAPQAMASGRGSMRAGGGFRGSAGAFRGGFGGLRGGFGGFRGGFGGGGQAAGGRGGGGRR